MSSRSITRRLDRIYGTYALGFAIFVAALAVAEHHGLPKYWIGFSFLVATIAVYAVIGVAGRTTDADEYFVAGRRVPAFYNGMATAADWMSAASFIGLAGTIYLAGYGGLAYVMGWTGGFCLVAVLLAPYLRRFGGYTIADFLAARYDSHVVRTLAVVATIVCSFTYVVAQIYGVGLIVTRLAGVDFVVGVFLGLGGVLICSFLGGMRAVTWTQVAQCIVLVVAYVVPAAWLAAKHTGVPVPSLVYGQQLAAVSAREAQLLQDPREQAVRAIYRERAAADAARLRDVAAELAVEQTAAQQHVAVLREAKASTTDIRAAERAANALPKTEAEARARWSAAFAFNDAQSRTLAGMPRQADVPESSAARANFVALVFVLVVGTAALPHVLVRSFTVPSASAARRSVVWALVFILLVYLTAPVLAVMVKLEIFEHLIGTPFDQLPAWIGHWAKVDPALLSVADVNGDHVLQLGEMHVGGDVVVLAAPEMAGLPYVVSGMVAAGGLAAALSTADGLLLAIANALSHDFYFRMLDPKASPVRRVMVSKLVLLIVALAAAAVAAQRPADIVFLVSAAFSLAAASLFPVLVLGIFWKRANGWGAAAGMLAGSAVTASYMALTQPWLRSVFGVVRPPPSWWGIESVSAGVFGVPVGFVVIIVVSLLTPAPSAAVLALVERLRGPRYNLGFALSHPLPASEVQAFEVGRRFGVTPPDRNLDGSDPASIGR